MMRSILGKEKLSFGHALLMLVKSIQSRNFPFTFFDKYDVGQPLRIFHLIDGFLSFWREAPPLLFDSLEGWADVQPMSDYCRVNSSHVCLLPCEDVFVLSQKMGEEAF